MSSVSAEQLATATDILSLDRLGSKVSELASTSAEL
jgi:hypothetical protein